MRAVFLTMAALLANCAATDTPVAPPACPAPRLPPVALRMPPAVTPPSQLFVAPDDPAAIVGLTAEGRAQLALGWATLLYRDGDWRRWAERR